MKFKTYNSKLITIACLLPIAYCLVFTGCQPGNVRKIDYSPIVGTWQTEGQGNPWKFVLQEDGRIFEVYRSDGLHMNLAEGGVQMELLEDVYVHYIYGPCTWTYNQDTNILKVTVIIDDFYIKAQDSELTCQVIDEFEAPLSEGSKSWRAVWKTTTKFNTPGPDEIVNGGTLTFKKEE